MHRELRKLLHTATGDSRFVVVVFLDVRGFSSFARMAESSESAVFLKSAYTAILDEYFVDASFFKPTGDGLLVVLDYDEGSLPVVVNSALEASLKLVEAFPTICLGDSMVNFEVPDALGIGLARGAATRLHSGEFTLDYSGRPLNRAARLMDVARPAGVVFSDSLGIDLVEDSLAKRFDADEVYIKGIAEDRPLRVHYLRDTTVIADAYKRPLHKTRIFAEPKAARPLRDLEHMGNFRLELTRDPLDRSSVSLKVAHPTATPSGTQRKGFVAVKDVRTTYGEDGSGPHVRANFTALYNELRSQKVRSTWKVTYGLEYAIEDD